MEQSLADRRDGEELIDTILGVCIRQTVDYSPPNYASSIWNGIMQNIFNFSTDRCTLME